MDEEKLKKLKSGTDIRGVAIEDVSPITLTDEAVEALSKAFAVWAKKRLQKDSVRVAVGYDARLSSPHIEKIVTNALTSCGCDAVETGLSSTPSMFMLLREGLADVSIEITASHLGYDRNGLKFFTTEGGLEAEDIDDIIKIAAAGSFPEGEGKTTVRSYMDEYSASLRKKIERECEKGALCGMKIIVDAGNGVGKFFAKDVLKPLGANIEGSLNLEPDGHFPNHVPNPECEEAIDGLSKAVAESGADMGIIFDTDCDRAAFVDERGEKINRNTLIALLAAILLEKRPGGTIVTDSVASTHVTEFIEKRGGKHLRYKRGYKNVIDRCRALNDEGVFSPLAVETSGHAAFAENFFLDDGAYMAVKMICCKNRLASKGLTFSDLIKDLVRPAEEDEVRIGFIEGIDFRYEGAAVIETLKKSGIPGAAVDKEIFDGVRFLFEDGWTLIRPSVHDPVMPINFESDSFGGDKKMAKRLLLALRPFESLNLEKLEEFIEK